jgi:hypothetical protein
LKVSISREHDLHLSPTSAIAIGEIEQMRRDVRIHDAFCRSIEKRNDRIFGP